MPQKVRMTRRVAFVLTPDFSNLGFALAVEALFVANWISQEKIFEWHALSADGLPVKASNSMDINVSGPLTTDIPYETVFVIASFDPKKHTRDKRIENWLRRAARYGVEVGGIENGSEFLASAGLLDGHSVSVHWDNLEGFQARYPKANARPVLYHIGQGRLSCAGAISILDMLLDWVRQLGYGDLAEDIGHHLLIGRARSGGEAQWNPDRDPGIDTDEGNRTVRRALAIMREAIEEPLDCAEIASRVGLSQRQLQRHFQIYLQSTLTKEYTRIRLAKAHQLLQQTDLSVTEISIMCGFASLENFSRVYRNGFGCSPSFDRHQTTSAPVFRHRQAKNRETA